MFGSAVISARVSSAIAILAICPTLATAQTISPRFAWTVGSAAEITTTVNLTTSGMSVAAPNPSARQVTDLSIEADSRGLVITETGRSIDISKDMATAGRLPTGQVMEKRQSRYLVSRDGAYRYVLDTLAALAQADSQMRALNALPAGPAGNVADRLANVISKRTATTIDEAHHRQWDFLVGWIIPRKWTRGDSAQHAVPVEVPNDSGRSMQVQRIMRYDGVVPCPTAESARKPPLGKCWQFTSTMHFPQEFMKPSIQRAKARMAANLPPEIVAELDARMPVPEQSVVTVGVYDAATMRPLRITNTMGVTSKSATMNSRIETVSTSNYVWR